MKKTILILFLGILMFSMLFSVTGQNLIEYSTSEKAINNSRDWTIVASFSIPGKASGLAWDGQWLYSGIYGVNGDEVYRINPVTGYATLQFSNPELDDSYGMTYDGDFLWTIIRLNPSKATKMGMDGTFLEFIELPDQYMSGLAFDNGDFWVCTYHPDPGTIYRVDEFGVPGTSFQSPGEQPWDICVENDNLWVAEYNGNMIYKLDKAGNILDAYPCENIKPAGIVWDGQYLWYVDGPNSSNSTLYKVDLGGVGTPEISVPVDEHDYNTVTIGYSSTWEMEIQNIGNADLVIEAVNIPSAVPIFTDFVTPYTIPEGGSVNVPLSYEPQEAIELNTMVTIVSSDPVHPEVEVVLTGHGVYEGPYIEIEAYLHDFQDVRMNAYTRWWIEISNLGDSPLILDGVISDNPRFMIDGSHQFPFEVPTLGSMMIGVWFNPTAEETYNGTISITSNDPVQNPVEVDVSGEGVYQEYPIGDKIWQYEIDVYYDNSPKAIGPVTDVTGDGIDDVIICSEDNYVRCFNGNSSTIADVIWEREVYSGSVYQQTALAIVEDLNNDTYKDVVVGTAWGDRSIIALSGKSGEIIWKHDTHEYGDGGWVYSVNARFDYNNDEIPDILASTGNDGSGTGPVRIYCLDALTGISIWECPLGGPCFSVIGVEDFTGDGIPDVIAGASNENETEGKVTGINGQTGNAEWNYIVSGSSVWALEQTDDANGDNVKDIIAGDFSGHYYLLNPVYGSVIESGSIGSYIILRFKMLDDVNQDGKRDVLFAHSGSNAIVIDGVTTDNIWLKSLADKSWNIDVIDDVSGDGINDVIIGTLFGNNYCYFLDGISGDELKSINIGTPVDAIASITDITGDGSMEAVVGGRNGMVYCYSGGLDTGVGYDDIASSEGLAVKVHPNPFVNGTSVTVETEANSLINIEIFDVKGHMVTSIHNIVSKSCKTIINWDGRSDSGKPLPAGVYILKVNIDGEIVDRKLLKQ